MFEGDACLYACLGCADRRITARAWPASHFRRAARVSSMRSSMPVCGYRMSTARCEAGPLTASILMSPVYQFAPYVASEGIRRFAAYDGTGRAWYLLWCDAHSNSLPYL